MHFREVHHTLQIVEHVVERQNLHSILNRSLNTFVRGINLFSQRSGEEIQIPSLQRAHGVAVLILQTDGRGGGYWIGRGEDSVRFNQRLLLVGYRDGLRLGGLRPGLRLLNCFFLPGEL